MGGREKFSSVYFSILSSFLIVAFCHQIRAEQCKHFRRLWNVNVTCGGHDKVTFNQTVSNKTCLDLCIERNCTAVAMETAEVTRWCCVLTSEDVMYHYGNHLLYYSNQISIRGKYTICEERVNRVLDPLLQVTAYVDPSRLQYLRV